MLCLWYVRGCREETSGGIGSLYVVARDGGREMALVARVGAEVTHFSLTGLVRHETSVGLLAAARQ